MSDECDKTVVMTSPGVPPPLPEGSICTACGIAMEPAANRPNFYRCSCCGRIRFRPPEELAPGSVVGSYRILKILANGGMSRLYLCCGADDAASRAVLKVLYGNVVNDSTAQHRFLREARLCRKLDHPNIVRSLETGCHMGANFIAMEFIDGRNLEQLVRAKKVFHEEVCVEIIRRVADALGYGWEQFKLLHRDIKPSNIMIDGTGEVKLLDFGIAKRVGQEGTAVLTMAGQSLGTPRFMSPEQFADCAAVDCRSDIYSLGATLYYILSGTYPVPGKNGTEIYDNLLHDRIVPIRTLRPETTPGCADLIGRMTDKDPGRRPSGWKELAACIAGLQPA